MQAALPGTATSGVAANGQLTFASSISGPGKLTFTAQQQSRPGFPARLNADNSYTGGTLVAGGVLEVSSAAADLGTGDVRVSSETSPDSVARLSIVGGVVNAINDSTTLTITGAGDVVILGADVNEAVGRLILGFDLDAEAAGTYGSSMSQATNKNDEFFSGPGMITVVPEPASPSSARWG